MDQTQISKLISYWLRHNPADAGLAADETGWVNTDGLLAALAAKGQPATLHDLIELCKSTDKVRWEINEAAGVIRATHGHSFPVVLLDKVDTPPETLYHGTAQRFMDAIREQGLLPMNRQFVHLTADKEMALTVARRHGKPVLLTIATAPLLADGWQFYHTSENVWLTTATPVRYLNVTDL